MIKENFPNSGIKRNDLLLVHSVVSDYVGYYLGLGFDPTLEGSEFEKELHVYVSREKGSAHPANLMIFDFVNIDSIDVLKVDYSVN